MTRPDLPTYLSEAGRRHWQWGETDCVLFCADWVWLCRGIDPAAAWRGTYHDEQSCLDRLIAHGGLVKSVSVGMTNIGLARTDVPTTGDVGIIMAPVHRRGEILRRPCGAICVDHGMWVVRTREGQAFGPAKPLKAWKAV